MIGAAAVAIIAAAYLYRLIKIDDRGVLGVHRGQGPYFTADSGKYIVKS